MRAIRYSDVLALCAGPPCGRCALRYGILTSRLRMASVIRMANKESLPFDIERAAWFIHESNLIEDERDLSRDHIRASLKKGRATGHVGAFLALIRMISDEQLPGSNDLCNAHALLLREQCGDRIPPPGLRGQFGRWRTCEVSVGYDHPPPPSKVPTLMAALAVRVAFFHGFTHERENTVDFIADEHHAFLKIHPFADGNGRISRLYANALLALNGLPLAVFTSDDKFGSYYPACSSPDASLMRLYLRAKIEHPELPLSLERGDS